MKTTIEINGYEIVIEQTDKSITVSALKDGESVEDFQLEVGDEEVKDFEDFEGEEGSEEELDADDAEDLDEEELDADAEDLDEEELDADAEEDKESVKLESFQSFISKKKK